MMKQLATFWLAALFAVSPLTAEQQKPLGEQLRVRWDGFNVIVIKDGVKHPFNVQKDMKAYAIENVRLLSAKASGDGRIEIDNNCQPNGRCVRLPSGGRTICLPDQMQVGSVQRRSTPWSVTAKLNGLDPEAYLASAFWSALQTTRSTESKNCCRGISSSASMKPATTPHS